MSIDACALNAYGLWIYTEPYDDFTLELKDDIQEYVENCNNISEYIQNNCKYKIPNGIEIFYGENGYEFLGISLTAPPWENSYKTKEAADADIQKALETLYKNVPPDYAEEHCYAEFETWIE